MKRNTLAILRILHCYSLQQHIFLAFCNDFDTHHRMLAYILLMQKQSIVIPEMTSKANSSHSPLFFGGEHGNVQNCKLSNFVKKLTKIATTIIFSQW